MGGGEVSEWEGGRCCAMKSLMGTHFRIEQTIKGDELNENEEEESQ